MSLQIPSQNSPFWCLKTVISLGKKDLFQFFNVRMGKYRAMTHILIKVVNPREKVTFKCLSWMSDLGPILRLFRNVC